VQIGQSVGLRKTGIGCVGLETLPIHPLEFFGVKSDFCCIFGIGSHPLASFLHWDLMELHSEFVVTFRSIRHFKDICE
jgi:hypothetical protein